MNNIECNGDWLIDYADGELIESAAAESHLAVCATCRGELQRLRASGRKLGQYFDALRKVEAPAEATVPTRRTSGRRWALVGAAAIAASLLAVALGINFWPSQPQDLVGQKKPEQQPPARQVVAEPDVLAQITRETQIAKLRATIAILEQDPSMQERRESLEKYLAESYQVDPSL